MNECMSARARESIKIHQTAKNSAHADEQDKHMRARSHTESKITKLYAFHFHLADFRGTFFFFGFGHCFCCYFFPFYFAPSAVHDFGESLAFQIESN